MLIAPSGEELECNIYRAISYASPHAYSDAMETHTRRIHLRRVSIGDIPRKGRADGVLMSAELRRGASAQRERNERATKAKRARATSTP